MYVRLSCGKEERRFVGVINILKGSMYLSLSLRLHFTLLVNKLRALLITAHSLNLRPHSGTERVEQWPRNGSRVWSSPTHSPTSVRKTKQSFVNNANKPALVACLPHTVHNHEENKAKKGARNTSPLSPHIAISVSTKLHHSP